MGEILEWVWDCPQCDCKKIGGSHRVCTQCAAPRPEGDIFYDPGNARIVIDSRELERARAGADSLCAFCGGSIWAAEDTCQGCGASKADSDKKRRVIFYPAGTEPRSNPEAPTPQSFDRRSSAMVPPEPAHNPRRNGFGGTASTCTPANPPNQWKLYALMASGVGLLALILFFMFRTHVKTVEAVSFPWTRSIQVEEYKTFTEDDWSIPTAGREKDHWQAIHHYNKVFDHNEQHSREVVYQVQTGTRQVRTGTRSRGNGYAEPIYSTEPVYTTRSRTEYYTEPVFKDVAEYHTKYRYEIERWVPTRTAVAQGVDQNASWPDPHLRANERKGSPSETYAVKFKTLRDDKEQKEYCFACPELEWHRVEVGGRYQIRVNGLGKVTEIIWPVKE